MSANNAFTNYSYLQSNMAMTFLTCLSPNLLDSPQKQRGAECQGGRGWIHSTASFLDVL